MRRARWPERAERRAQPAYPARHAGLPGQSAAQVTQTTRAHLRASGNPARARRKLDDEAQINRI